MCLGGDRRDRAVTLHGPEDPLSDLVGAVRASLVHAHQVRPPPLGLRAPDRARSRDPGVDYPGAHRGHADPIDAKLVAHRLREPEHRELGRAVRDQRRVGVKASHRGNVHDVTTEAARDHRWHERGATVHDAHQVDRDQPIPVLERRLKKTSDDSHARVVDKQINGLAASMHRLGEGGDLLATGHVNALGEHLAAERLRPRSGARERGLIQIADRQTRAAPSAQKRCLAANTRPSASNHHHAAVQTFDIHEIEGTSDDRAPLSAAGQAPATALSHSDKPGRATDTVARMHPEWHQAQTGVNRQTWEQVLQPMAAELAEHAHAMSTEVVETINKRLPDLMPDAESFEANRASAEASILGFAQILEQGADPASASLGPATLAYTREGVQRGIPLTTLIRSYRLGHAAVWERLGGLISRHAADPDQRDVATAMCSQWLFAYVDAALCLAEDFYGAEREQWARSTAAARAETIAAILAGTPIDAGLASRRLGYELERQHTALIAWLQAHEEGQDAQAALETAIQDIRAKLDGTRALVHPLGILSAAGWIATHQPVSTARLDDLRFDTGQAPGVRIAIGEPAEGITGFRQSHTEAMHARRVAELAARPAGAVTVYSRVALAAIATADLDQARTFVKRELHGLTATDDATGRLTATLRTYLEEHSSRSRTARRLGIHENTVSYRIKQAEELLGRSVDQRTLELRVALALANLVNEPAGR